MALRERIEEIVLSYLCTGEKSFHMLLAEVRNKVGYTHEVTVNREFENAMMSLWIDDKIEQIDHRIFKLKG